MAIVKKIKLPDGNTHTIGTYEELIEWGPSDTQQQSNVSPIGMALSNEHSANRLAFLNPLAVMHEYSSDGGTTWTVDTNMSGSQKISLCTSGTNVPIGRPVGSSLDATTNSVSRITLTCQDGTNSYLYTNPKKMLINVSAAKVLELIIETRTGANYLNDGAWSRYGGENKTYALSGRPGWNDIPLILGTLGGGTTQTSNNWQLRLTIRVTSIDPASPKVYYLNRLRIYGANAWNANNNYALTGHIYSFDANQNVTFPAKVTATEFSGTATKAKQDESGNNIKATYASSLTIDNDGAVTLKNKNGGTLSSGTIPVPKNTICPIYTITNYASQTATCNYTYTELKDAYDNGFNIAPLLKVSNTDTTYSANCTITYSNNSFIINVFIIGYSDAYATEYINEYDITHSNNSISFSKAIATDLLQQKILDSDWIELPLQTTSTNPIGVQAYTSDYKPKYRKIGHVVELEGIVKVRSQVSASNADSTFKIGTLPSEFRPPRAIRFFCAGQGSTMEHWVLMIESNGAVTGGRYGTSSAVAITTSKALPFAVTFMV